MIPTKINDEKALQVWLNDKPHEWAQSIALRAALRALPYVAQSSKEWLTSFALLPFGALVTSWMQLVDVSTFVRTDESRANARFGGETFDFKLYKSSPIAALAADASYHSADAQSESEHLISDCVKGVSRAAEAFCYASVRHGVAGENGDSAAANSFARAAAYTEPDTLAGAAAYLTASNATWGHILADCRWLTDESNGPRSSRIMMRRRLWLGQPPKDWTAQWQGLNAELRGIDPNYDVWIDWYERRIRGERSAFGIPGDKYRTEDKKILRRLAEATNQDFWSKGHEYVNATLKNWLDEARERAAPAQALPVGMATETSEALALLPLPPQEATAITYGVNEQGKLDRLPSSDQAHLRDLPDQRRAYADLRAAAAELLGEGQRLGHRLHRALDRFLHSLPDGFADAEAYLVWRDANALRRLHRAHREAAKSPEPDEARLEPVVAEGLGGLLDLYNNFAFADDGLRAKDEARIAPQERASAEAEAKAAMPLIDAILANPEIATPEALDDIAADAENAELPADDPYSAQVLQQSNECRKNFWAAALAWGAKTLASPKQVGKAVSIGLVTGAAGVVGKVAMTSIIGTDYGPLLPFIAANAEILQCYVAIAFQSFEHLPSLIDQLKSLWAQLRD